MTWTPKIVALAGALFTNLVGGDVGGVSRDNDIAATPPREAFRIWGRIYAGLLGAAFAPPFIDPIFNESMDLNAQWIRTWTAGDIVGARDVIVRLRDTNLRLAEAQAARADGEGWVLEAYDTYATWLQVATVLNEWIVRVHGPNPEPDRSREALRELLDRLDADPALRPGQRYVVDYVRGFS